jgi:hypothetical protein
MVLLICIDLRYLRDIMIFDINRYLMRTLEIPGGPAEKLGAGGPDLASPVAS